MFVASWDNGVFKSIDNGDNWQRLPFRFENSVVNKLIVHGSLLFAKGARSYRSGDDGATWTEIIPEPNSLPDALCFIGDTLYAGTKEGFVYSSHDYGTNWELAGRAPGKWITTFASHGSSLFFSADSGCYRSDDGGRTWNAIQFADNRNKMYAFAAHDSVLVIVTGENAAFYDEIYYSMNSGVSWSRGGENINTNSIRSIIWDGNRFIATGGTDGRLFASVNGDSWQEIKAGFADYISTIHVNGDTLFAGGTSVRESGIYRSIDNGASWQPSSRGFSTTRISGIAEQSGVLFAAGGSGMYVSRDNGSEWVRPPAQMPFESVSSLTATGNALLAGMVAGGGDVIGALYRTADAGASWSRVDPGPGSISVMAASGDLVVAIMYSSTTLAYHFYSSIDGGATWSLGATPPINTSTGDRANDMVFAGNTLFLATSSDVYRSLDTGMTWTIASNGLEDSYITTLRNMNGVLFAGTYKAVVGSISIYRSTDNGDSWQPVYSNDVQYDQVTDFASQGNTVIASFRQSGMVRSTDSGDTWTPFNNGLTNTSTVMVEFAGGSLFSAPVAGGIFRTAAVSSVKTQEGNAGTATAQLYPNPCHGSATIRYDVLPGGSGKTPVVLSIYNALGKEIDVLLSQYQAPGIYSMDIDVSGLAPGTYFYRVKTGTRCETHSFIVIGR